MPAAPATDPDLAHTYDGAPLGQARLARPSILSWLGERAQQQAADPFVVAVAKDDNVDTLSYGALDVRSRRVAGWVRHELEAGPGDVVALLPVNDVPSVVAIFGLLRSGCSVLVLNPTDPVLRLRSQVDALATRAVLRPASVPPGTFPGAVAVQESAADAVEPDARIDPLADALLFGTSGSTAASKLVAQSHANGAVNAAAASSHHRLSPGDRLLGCLPIHHVNGLHFTLFATLAAGSTAILAHAFDPLRYPRLVERFRPRIASVVPSVLDALLETWRQPAFPVGFDYFVSAAAPLTARTARAISEKLGVRVVQGYGLTETTNFSTTMPPDLPEHGYRRLMLDAEIPSIGTALPGCDVAVLDADGKRAAPGEVGEICIRGHTVMTRYAGNAEATAEAFRGGWFHSQDLGFEVDDGDSGRRFVVVTGRSKNVAKVRGESVSLDEMERVLAELPQVQDAACMALPHRFLGEEIVAAVVSREIDDAGVRDHLRAVFSPTSLPQRIVRLEAIPRTPTGKILRPELARELAALADAGATR